MIRFIEHTANELHAIQRQPTRNEFDGSPSSRISYTTEALAYGLAFVNGNLFCNFGENRTDKGSKSNKNRGGNNVVGVLGNGATSFCHNAVERTTDLNA